MVNPLHLSNETKEIQSCKTPYFQAYQKILRRDKSGFHSPNSHVAFTQVIHMSACAGGVMVTG